MLGGLLLRLVFYSASLPSGGLPFVVNEGNYVGIAGPLSEGQGFVDKWAWLRPPGYPAFLAFFLLVWKSLTATTLAQILLSVLNVGLIYALTMEIFAFRPEVPRGKAQAVGLIAAGLMAVNPQVVLYANLFMPESLYMLTLTAMLWLLLRGIRLHTSDEATVSRQSLLMFALAGLAAASAIYLRSLLLTFVPLMMGWLWGVIGKKDKQKGIKDKLTSKFIILPLAAFLLTLATAILLWTVRNYFEYNRFMLVDAIGGLNIWQYNGDLSRDDVITRLMEIPNPVDRDRYASEQGINAIISNPGRFASDAVERFADAWPVESFNELRISLRNKYPGIDCLYLDVYAWLETAFYIGLGLLAI